MTNVAGYSGDGKHRVRYFLRPWVLCRGLSLSRETVFSSIDLPPHLSERDRFSLWQDIHATEIWPVEYGISEDLPFEAAIEATAVGRLVLRQMSGTIRHATRKASNIADDGNG